MVARLRVLILAACMTVLGAFSVAQPAAAASNGAEVTNVTTCYDFGFAVFCQDDHVVFKVTETPSGTRNISGAASSISTLTYSGGGCIQRSTARTAYHTVALNSSSDATESNTIQRNKFVSACNGTTVTCLSSLHVHVVNGVLQFFRNPDAVCTVT